MQDLQNIVEEYNDKMKSFLYVIELCCNGEMKYSDEEADLSNEVVKDEVKRILKSNNIGIDNASL